MTSLNAFFRPQGVAVIGASREPGKLGHDVVRNLIAHGYTGPIYPINPRATDILGRQAYPTIQDVPDPLDLAVIVVPAGRVVAEMEACGGRGVPAVIVVSGGFREVGAEGAEREAAIQAIAARYGIALLGPNCIGTIDTHTPLNTTFVTGQPEPGEIALLSQSGATAAVIMDWAQRVGVGFSRIVSLGNQAGVTDADMLAALVEDEHTRVVTAYIEGVADGPAFLAAASGAARRVPVVALKVGRGAAGAKAISSHTGALAGAEAAYNAAFRRAGVLRAERLEDMLDWARALAWQPLPTGNRVAVLTNAGGPGIMAVDALEAAGLQLAPLTEDTKTYLRERTLPASSVENPVDILAGSDPATYGDCLAALLRDETVDAAIVICAPQDWFPPLALAQVIGQCAVNQGDAPKPVLSSVMGLTPGDDATQAFHRDHIPNYTFPERASLSLGALWRRAQWLAGQVMVEDTSPQYTETVGAHSGAPALEGIHAGWLPPEQVNRLLTAYGVTVPGDGLAYSADEAAGLADSLGYPVALKLAGVTHKSDVGGVVLNLESAAAVRDAYSRLTAAHAGGVQVQAMISGEAEIIVGVVRDPQFGPLVMAGLGGTQVELLGDTAFELAPLSAAEASAMLDRTAAGKVLAGYRGKAPADRDAVIQAILALAQIALDWPQIAEIEINPLIVRQQGAVAVDARVRSI
ncbi:MAG: acetate--CoA ligase family protein [Anaerolineaceae bacterium]|nr:acetate--CoA ligase family protein [Anaerolineaceae bacterium]